MTTLVLSDLHLGSSVDRDVLRRHPLARRRLVRALDGVERLVLLGDTVELLEGRWRRALALARPVLSSLARALDPAAQVILVAGNHDQALVRPWVRRRLLARDPPLELDGEVPPDASPALRLLVDALGAERTTVRYPGVWLDDGVYATHGHYLDYHLLPEFPRRLLLPPLRRLARALPQPATLEDYESTGGSSLAALQNLVAAGVPDPVATAVDATAGRARRAALGALPLVEGLPGVAAIGPLTALSVGHRLPGAAVRGMAEVVRRLGIDADHVIFGHVHRAGPLCEDRDEAWRVRGTQLHNTGSWVWDSLLLANARRGHPYWPGRAVRIEPGKPPEVLSLLDALPPRTLRP